MSDERDHDGHEDVTTLIGRVKAGDTELFWRLVEPYQQSLRVTAYSLLRNTDDAAEVVQETMLKAMTHLSQLREGQSLKGWLMTIAINEARMRMRKARSEPLYEEAEREDSQSFTPRDYASWKDIPSDALEQKEIWEAVTRGLQSLSPLAREVFVLRDIQHVSVGEVAAILGIGEDKVRIRLHRARLQMRELLSPLFREASRWLPMQMVIDMPAMMMHRVIRCKRVIKEISNYIEGDVDPCLRAQIEEHVKYCRRCKVLLDTIRKVVYLVADEKVFLPPFAAAETCGQPSEKASKAQGGKAGSG